MRSGEAAETSQAAFASTLTESETILTATREVLENLSTILKCNIINIRNNLYYANFQTQDAIIISITLQFLPL